MRSACFARGSALAGDRAPSVGASIKSMDTSSWPPILDSRPTAHTAEISSGGWNIYRMYLTPFACCDAAEMLTPLCVWSDRGVLGKQGYQCQGEYFSPADSNFWSNIAYHLLFKHENTRGITCCWVTTVIWSHAITPEPRIYSITRAENKMKHNIIILKITCTGFFFLLCACKYPKNSAWTRSVI